MNGDRFVYGLDPASKFDYFGIVVHRLPTGPRPLPVLAELQAVTHTDYLAVYDRLTKDLFRRFPPYYIVTDYNTEKTLSQVLKRDYGDQRVEAMNFGNETKNQLKDDGLAILKQGYVFPNPGQQKNKAQAKLLNDLMQQLKNEQMLFTPSGKITFDHPSGQHNDLAIAWELSVHGCMKFLLKFHGDAIVSSINRPKPRGWGIPDNPVADAASEVLLNKNNRLVSQETKYPE